MNRGTEVERLSDVEVFDAVKAVSLIILVVYISSTGRLGDLINCSVQRMVTKHLWLRHLIFIISIFLVRALPIFEDASSKTSLAEIWVFTLVVYVAFIMATKSKWYFVLPALALILIAEHVRDRDESFLSMRDTPGRFMIISAAIILVLGFLHYLVSKMRGKGRQFSLYHFWFGTDAGCRRAGRGHDDMLANAAPRSSDMREE